MGNRIGPYETKEVLGKGGMGTVYRAIDPTVNREVALKVINPELSQNTLLMKRFKNEAIAMARLCHPNIVVLYNFFSEADLNYIVMEYVRGKSLSQMIRDGGALSWERAFPIFRQILNAIDHAHSQGIIHRDIKPSNFLLQHDGIVKVTDFGVAKVFGGEELTRAGSTLGTSHYMSPEQILGQSIGISSDIYSLGITLFEMMTGRVPFSGNSDFEIQRGHLEILPPSPRQFNPNVPKEVEAAILKSLEKRPEKRFSSAHHFLQSLSETMPHLRKGFTPHSVKPRGGVLKYLPNTLDKVRGLLQRKPRVLTRGAGFTEKGPIFSLPEWLTLKGKWPLRFSGWKNMFPFAPLDSWVARYQRLPAEAKWMILLAGTLLIILFLVILFSISTRSLV